MNPYFAPGLDGRRPLFGPNGRIAEHGPVMGSRTEPVGSYQLGPDPVNPRGVAWLPLWDCGDPRARVAVDGPSESALCRVAVEDWLRACGEFIALFPPDANDRDTGHFLELDAQYDPDQYTRRCFNGPTFNDALNAAAHAVADALDIPH